MRLAVTARIATATSAGHVLAARAVCVLAQAGAQLAEGVVEVLHAQLVLKVRAQAGEACQAVGALHETAAAVLCSVVAAQAALVHQAQTTHFALESTVVCQDSVVVSLYEKARQSAHDGLP